MAAAIVSPLPATIGVRAVTAPLPASGMVIATLPAAGRPIDGALLRVMVAEAARGVLDRDGRVVAAGGWVDDAAGAAASPASLDDVVIAAHERRIALLRERMAALCSAGGAASMLDALRDRLHRAEAARGLAVARAGGDRATVVDRDRCLAGGAVLAATGGDLRGRVPMIARRGGAALVSVRYAGSAASASRARGERHGRTTTVAWHASGHRASMPAALAYRSSLRPQGGFVASAYAPGGRIVRYGRADTAARSRLARARRSLAAARRALEGPATPGRVLAGLWRWEGSDTWRLVADRAATS